jgi:hypothetical protein
MNDNSLAYACLGFLIGFLLGIVITSAVDSSYEKKACEELEQKISINLAYTYNQGCQRAEDL